MANKSNPIDYENYSIDTQDPKDFTYAERRTDILNIIKSAGHPYAVPQRELAKRYGVSQPQIAHDMEALRDHIDKHIGRNANLLASASFKNALNECDDAQDRFDLVMRWMQWLQSTGRQETAAMKIEQTNIDGNQSDSYEIIADDDAISVDGEVVDVASLRTGSAESRRESDEGEE